MSYRPNFFQIGIDKVWRFFVSLKLTFFLLALIALGLFIGMGFDQTLGYVDFFEEHKLSASKQRWFDFFELYDAFHSWWFGLAVVFLALNLIACSIERLPRIWFEVFYKRPYLTGRRLDGLKLKSAFICNDLNEAHRALSVFMLKRFRRLPLGQNEYYFSEHEIYGRFGVYVVHISLLIIMFSSIIATNFGIDGLMLIKEGEKNRFAQVRGPGGIRFPMDLGFNVGCSDFRLKTFLDDTPMDFESDIAIFKVAQSEPLVRKTIRVNDPLDYDGFKFYQASYRPLPSEKLVSLKIGHEGKVQHHRVFLGQSITLADQTVITPQKLFDDFAGIGQALRIEHKSAGQPAHFFHVFRQYPSFDAKVRKGSFDVVFVSADQLYATGISLGKLPGLSVIFLGFLLLLCGVGMSFFMRPRRFFASIEAKGPSFILKVAMQTFRQSPSYEEEWQSRIKRMASFQQVQPGNSQYE